MTARNQNSKSHFQSFILQLCLFSLLPLKIHDVRRCTTATLTYKLTIVIGTFNANCVREYFFSFFFWSGNSTRQFCHQIIERFEPFFSFQMLKINWFEEFQACVFTKILQSTIIISDRKSKDLVVRPNIFISLSYFLSTDSLFHVFEMGLRRFHSNMLWSTW